MDLKRFEYVKNLLRRNGISDNTSKWSVYKFMVEKILPLYDKSLYMLGNADFMLRKIEVLDSVDRILGPNEYPMIEENVLFSMLLADLYKLEPDDFIFSDRHDISYKIAMRDFEKDIQEKFPNPAKLEDILLDISTMGARCHRSYRFCKGGLTSAILHDVDVLAHICDMKFLFKAWTYDFFLDHEKRDLLATRTMAYIRLKYLYGYQGTVKLVVPKLIQESFYTERFDLVKETLKSKEKFFQILEA